jgi:hypothetical protein
MPDLSMPAAMIRNNFAVLVVILLAAILAFMIVGLIMLALHLPPRHHIATVHLSARSARTVVGLLQQAQQVEEVRRLMIRQSEPGVRQEIATYPEAVQAEALNLALNQASVNTAAPEVKK